MLNRMPGTGHMDKALTHFDRVSIFGPSALVLVVVLAIDFAISALHSYQEWRGAGAPLWRNFGAIVGVHVPDWLGFLAFTVALTVALWLLSLAGMAGWLPFKGPVNAGCAAAALGALVGARLSDTLVSHVAPHALGYRPNPGLSSTPLYVVEALFIGLAFQPGLAADPRSAACGFALGALFFVLVLPGLWLLGLLVPGWKRPRWRRWQPMPQQ